MAKQPGKRSQQQNDFLEPGTPINVVATNVGTNRPFNDGAASISFSVPEGSPAADLFTVTVYRGAVTEDLTATNTTGTSSPIVVGGLDSNVSYRFTVSASNATGSTAESVSTPLILITTVPATPAAPTVQNFSNDQKDYLSWSHPANGGSTLLTYFWESDDAKANSVAFPATTTQVTQEGGTSQKYRIRVTNANGTSEWSPYSGTNTTPPFFPPFFPFFPPYFPFFPFFPPTFPFFPFFPPMFPFFPFFPPMFPFFPFFPPMFPPFFPFFPPMFPFFPPFFPFFPPMFKARFCLSASTEILTVNGWVAAETVKVGDRVLSISSDEISMHDLLESRTSKALPEQVTVVETEVISVDTRNSTLIGFNNLGKDYSVDQPIFVKSVEGITYKSAKDIVIGDTLLAVNENGLVQEIAVDSIEIDETESKVYEIRTSPEPWFITKSSVVIA
jgi:hypothetical protein